MGKKAENIVLRYLQSIDFPGIREGENSKDICNYLKANDYNFTPDLIAGPTNIKEAPLEGLFFIDVIQPTVDLLFESAYYEGCEPDVPKEFNKILKKNHQDSTSTNIDMLPNSHHDCYLAAMNKKLEKYAHKRMFHRNGVPMVSANFGLVHHFYLGEIKEGKGFKAKELITLLDYIRFYKRLSSAENIDLKNAENLLLKGLVDKNLPQPYMLLVGRDWPDLPCLFFMLHIMITIDSNKKHLSLVFLNSSNLSASGESYPVHRWFTEKILFNSQGFDNDEAGGEKITITLGSDAQSTS